MLIPIKKRTLENLVDEVGELQADVAALDAKLKKKKAALKQEMNETNAANVQGRRFQATYVIRRTSKTNWQAIREALDIPNAVVDAYSQTATSEYPLVKARRDVK